MRKRWLTVILQKEETETMLIVQGHNAEYSNPSGMTPEHVLLFCLLYYFTLSLELIWVIRS